MNSWNPRDTVDAWGHTESTKLCWQSREAAQMQRLRVLGSKHRCNVCSNLFATLVLSFLGSNNQQALVAPLRSSQAKRLRSQVLQCAILTRYSYGHFRACPKRLCHDWRATLRGHIKDLA